MEVLLIILIFQIAGGTLQNRKFSRTVLESSNSPNLTVSSISLVDKGEKQEDDSNSTWKTKGFSTTDVNILIAEYPNSFFLPQKSPSYMNSSRLFQATNTADLTVIFRQFKHSLVYLNFSYYIGTVPEKKNETEVELVGNSTNETSQVPAILIELSPTGLLENQTLIDLQEKSNSSNATETPEPIPIFHDLARRKRSIESSAELNNSSNATSPEAKNSSSPSDILEHSNTLLQAVEMIKTAAAALTKETLADPSNKTPTGNEKDKKEIKTEKPKSKEEEEHHHHHRHRKPEILHKGSKGKKNKKSNKKHEKSPEHVGTKNEEEESSSSSSSEEDERVGKKKISYKTWKASFEKRNRPPGLYVTVNDDIIFDNWEGLWDKHFVMGKWTGANTKPLGEGMWNQTQLFINWEDVPMNVLKITFEWEPMTPNSYLILSDITVSTVETATCAITEFKMVHRHEHEPKLNKSESENKEKSEKAASSTSLSTAKPTTATSTTTTTEPSSSTAQPLIIIKNGEVEGSFQIIKMGKEGTTEIENVKYQELERNASTHRIGDEMLKTLLKLMKNDNKTNNSIPSSSTSTTPSPTALANEEPSQEVKNLSSQGKEASKKRERNEDRETAVLISVVTGSIAVTILVLTLKKYVELSKSKNNNGNDRND